jgi:hypothetical protein
MLLYPTEAFQDSGSDLIGIRKARTEVETIDIKTFPSENQAGLALMPL